MRIATLLDTSIATDNLGDEIIMDSVRTELLSLMPDVYFHTVPTHDYLGRKARKILKASEFGIVGGTNIMSSKLLRGANWKLTPLDTGSMHDIVLMGVGWMDYTKAATSYARYIYDNILSKTYLHAARDEYSKGRMAEIRPNSINTSCPTMWRLDDAHCAVIPTRKAAEAVVALTFYRADRAADTAFLELVVAHYDTVHFWIQQYDDLAYVRSLGNFPLRILPPNVAAYTDFLESESVDFLGSRLHGGIRALHSKRRTLILAVDNRAREIGRDTGLPVVERSDLEAIKAWIGAETPTRITLPHVEIARWRQQFSNR